MRIHEILFSNDNPAEGNSSDSYCDFSLGPSSYDLANLANAFTKHGVVKYLWNLDTEEQALPGAETEVTPSRVPEPPTASQAGRLEVGHPNSLDRLDPSGQYARCLRRLRPTL
jgi:hypothetical protein